ncbi:DUF7094 domain-containing protein [Halospeciosus flavus]|uniref:Uncharacterized protein n=1 Tax=Halospeciosus flavus TaxID=3032283 RepID=A0ABD5Z7S8_9EURY|nr:hypothetical protein [Halospeciosus flavus]
MPRVRPLLVALLTLSLVVAAAGPSVLAATGTAAESSAPGPLISPDDQTPNVLGVETERAGFGSPNLSVTRTLRMQQSSVTRELTRRTLERRLAVAPNESVREQVLLNATARLDDRSATLRAEAETAKQAFRRGELTATQYAARLATVHSRATDLLALTTFVSRQAEEPTVTRRAARIRASLVLLTGPVRSSVAERVRGRAADVRVYAGVGESGTALATVSGGEYVRAASRPAFLVPSQPGIPDGLAMLDYARQLYPWAMNNSDNFGANAQLLSPYAYQIDIHHRQGRTVSYVGSTGGVFHEEQRLRLSRLPVERDFAVTTNNTTLAVDRTYAGGPLYVNVTNATGAPLDAEITVANETVGRTGADGHLWTLSPAGTYVVTAQVDGVRVNTTVSATDPAASLGARTSAAEP